MRGTPQHTTTAHDELIRLAQASLVTSPDDASRVAAARRVLHDGVPAMLAPTLPARPEPRPKRRAASVMAMVTVSMLAGSAGALALTQPSHLGLTGLLRDETPKLVGDHIDKPVVVQLPHLRRGEMPINVPRADAEDFVDAAIAKLAADKAAQEQQQQQAQGGTSNGGSSSGSTGGTTGGTSSGGSTSGGGGSVPAAYVDQLGFSASTTGAGTVSVSVNVHTTASMAVSVSCTLGGATQGMSGPGTVAGSASYSGSFTGLAPGTYSINCTVPGQMTSNTKQITVSE